MDRLPVIETRRLVLTSATQGDIDAFWHIWTLPEVRRHLFEDQIMERSTAAEWITTTETYNHKGLGAWAIRERLDGPLVGHMALVPALDLAAFNPEFDGEIEFGISLHPDHWNKGYALEALTPVLDHGLNTAGLKRILGVADAPNHASRKLQERAGFRLIREMVWSGYPVVVNVFENT